ncbi:MAG: response regulator [Proteobacteria bacterium]|jgi:signal transduction histidine kinase/CheY-like chemotaxis protein/HPt (histidine-containing phosphotransfer) domain-containing protein|nr:response regulator [Ramlibacter sp.]MCA0214468.1 response regulator [Pseudomonadota bacterium]
MRLYSLRRILGISLLFLTLVPAVLVAWLMARASSQAAEDLAGSILTHVAGLVQSGTEDHLRQAHGVLNGLFAERMTPSQVQQARAWLREPAQFEAMAFALTRQSPSVPLLYFGNVRGEYFGVHNTADGVQVSIRRGDDAARSYYLAQRPGDRSRPLRAQEDRFEPRTRFWYAAAMQAKGRVFSDVQVQQGQLMVSLSQPVYDADGGAAGVFGTDLYLKHLADALRTQRISSRGAAFVVDEKGALVASSAGDALFTLANGRAERRSPRDSANAVIRASFAGLQGLWASRSADTVASDTRLRRLPTDAGTLLMVQRPFGEALGLRWTLVVAAPETDFTAEISRAWKMSLGVIAALVALSTLIALLVATGIGRRLGRLSQAAQQLGRGDVPVIDQATRIREIRQLSQVLHDSAQQLQGYREQVKNDARALQEANETLEARVEQRTAELAASREEALAAARAKAAFLATMSHEIRTPLNGVVGMSTLLAETPLDAEQRDYLQTVRLSSDQLLAVINDILDFSKIESGKLDLESEPLSLRGAVEEACDIAAPRAREKGLELIIDVAEARPGGMPGAIKGDITRLRQVLINLVNNAVKFTAQGEVTVQARLLKPDDGAGRAVIEFRVTDSGIGIPPERLASLFEAFTQVDASTTRKFGGTGLGLAICKRLVALMGGEIGVESELGRGSTFWFTIAAESTEEAAPAMGPSLVGTLKANRAMIVDDHATNVRILTRQLQLWGMEVVSAESGAQALAMLREASGADAVAPGREAWLPDIIVTDMHMPEMDGVTLARTIRANPDWRDIPLLLLSSGFMPVGDENASLFDARLLKPARQSQLFDTIARCISSDNPGGSKAGTLVMDVKKHATVLVADDNAVNLKVACAMLLKLGYDILTAVDGQEAVEVVAHAMMHGRRIDAILMDVNMPDVDGLQATQQILAAWGDRAPPIIALTAAASDEDRTRCEAAGMNDYLTKPLQVSALAQTIEKWVQQARGAPPDAPASAAAAALVAQPSALRDADMPAGPVMDFSRLNEFKEFDDEALSMTREVVGLFIADAPRRLDAIGQAIVAGDPEELSRAAHALKGAAGNIGAVAIQAICATLEADAKAGLAGDMGATRMAQLRWLLDETRTALAPWA